MDRREAQRLIREALRSHDPRRGLEMIRKAEKALGRKLPEEREAIGREAVQRARLLATAS